MIYKIIGSCQKATMLMEKRDFHGLSWDDHLRLRFHLLSCNACKLYLRQSRQLQSLLREHFEQTPQTKENLADWQINLKKIWFNKKI